MQKIVNLYNAPGVPGAFAAVNPLVSTALGRIATEDCPIGGFCWDDPETEGNVVPKGEGKPLGFVARDVIYTIVNVNTEAQDFVPAGCNVNVQVKGDFYVKCEGAKKGAAVYASAGTGAVATEGEETNFIFTKDADENGLTVISSL